MLHQTPSVETYRQLREAAGLSPKTREAAERGPPGTLFAVQVLPNVFALIIATAVIAIITVISFSRLKRKGVKKFETL